MKYFFLSLFFFFALMQTVHAQSATLYFIPATGVFTQGQTVSVNVMVNTGGEFANAVGAYFTYPADKFDLVSIEENDDTDSVFSLFVPEDSSPGNIRINGASFAPGFSGVHRVASVKFLAKAPGTATLAFTPDAVVLRNSDSQNILNNFSSGSAVFTITSFSGVISPTSTPIPSPLLTPTPVSTSSQNLIRDVTVENITEDSAVISWKTAVPTISKIVYNGQTLLDGLAVTNHRVLLSDLTPDTEYTFQVDQHIDKGQFRTKAVNLPQVQEEMRDFFDRVPGGLVTALILLVLIGGSVLFLIARLKR